MITRPLVRPLGAIKQRWPLLLVATLYSAAVVYLYQNGNSWVDAPVAISAMLGTVLSILLAFRTAASYDRWWEARKIWGAIVNDSRTFARQTIILIRGQDGKPLAAIHKELIHRQIAWSYALTRYLRRVSACRN